MRVYIYETTDFKRLKRRDKRFVGIMPKVYEREVIKVYPSSGIVTLYVPWEKIVEKNDRFGRRQIRYYTKAANFFNLSV